MQWIKVNIKHVDYDMASAPDSVFRAWVKLMTFVAAIEKIPTSDQLATHLGPVCYQKLCKYLISTGTDLGHVMAKVMEDVAGVVYSRECSKKRQKQYREVTRDVTRDNMGSNASRNGYVTDVEKSRVDNKKASINDTVPDKDKTDQDHAKRKPFLDFKYLEEQNLKNLLKAMGGDKEALKAHLKEMHFYEARIIEALEKARIV